MTISRFVAAVVVMESTAVAADVRSCFDVCVAGDGDGDEGPRTPIPRIELYA